MDRLSLTTRAAAQTAPTDARDPEADTAATGSTDDNTHNWAGPGDGPPAELLARDCTAVLELRGVQVAKGPARLRRVPTPAGEWLRLEFGPTWLALPPAQFRSALRAVIPGQVTLDEYAAFPLAYRDAQPEVGGVQLACLTLALLPEKGAVSEALRAAVRADYNALLATLPPELGGRYRATAGESGRWVRAAERLPELERRVLVWTGAQVVGAARCPGPPPQNRALFPAGEPGRWHWRLDAAGEAPILPEGGWSWCELPAPPQE